MRDGTEQGGAAGSPGGGGEARSGTEGNHGWVPAEKACERIATRGGLARIFHYGSYFVLVTLVAWFDPGGAGDALDRASERVAYRLIVGPLYAGAPYDGTIREAAKGCPPGYRKPQVAAVVLGEKDLSALGGTWPMELGFHAQVLRGIARYRPRAVFMDFVFPDQRDEGDRGAGVERLGKVVRDFKAPCQEGESCSPIPIYLARAAGEGVAPIREDLLGDVGPHLVDVPIAPRDGLLRSYWPYVKVDGRYDRRRPTAAFRVFTETSAVEQTPIGERFYADMEIVWSSNVGLMNRKWMRGCQTYDSSIALLVNYVIDGSAGQQFCPFSESVPVLDLIANPEDPDIACLLSDAIIVYGADLGVGGDRVSTMVHPSLAGMYAHAMALDNLLYFGDDYKKSSIRVGSLTISKGILEWIFSIVLVYPTLFFIRRRYRRGQSQRSRAPARSLLVVTPRFLALRFAGSRDDRDRPPPLGANALTWLAIEVCYFTAAVTFAVFTYLVLDLGPGNWLGLFGLASTVLILARRHLIECWFVNIASAMGARHWR